jgi:hypothetical protein
MTTFIIPHIMCASCHQGMTRPQAADGDDLHIHVWWVAANVLIKKSRTAEKKCF